MKFEQIRFDMSDTKGKQSLPLFTLFEERADILDQLFTDNELDLLAPYIVECSESGYIEESEITIAEKCRIVLDEYEVEKEKIDPLSVAIDATKQFDFHDLYLKSFSPQVEELVEEDSEPIKDYSFFLNSIYFNRYCQYEKLNDDEIKSLSDYCLDCGENDTVSSCFSDEKRFKSFVIFSTAAYIEREQKRPDTARRSSSIRLLRVAYKVVDRVKSKYDLWESSVGDVVKQEETALSYEFFKQYKSDLQIRQLVLLLFVSYYKTYSDNWGEFCFEIELAKRCNSPVNTLNFINYLKENRYCREFCDEYNNYIESKGIKPLFNISVIVGEIPTLSVDSDKGHEDWFEKIHKSKLGSGKDSDLYRATSNLFDWLKKDGYIPERTPESLFIYRFTGFQTPLSLDYVIEWTGKTKNTLAFLFKCLYTYKDGGDIVKPPYSKLAKFFTPAIENGSQFASSVNAKKKFAIIKLLQDCGFVNVDPSKIK